MLWTCTNFKWWHTLFCYSRGIDSVVNVGTWRGFADWFASYSLRERNGSSRSWLCNIVSSWTNFLRVSHQICFAPFFFSDCGPWWAVLQTAINLHQRCISWPRTKWTFWFMWISFIMAKSTACNPWRYKIRLQIILTNSWCVQNGSNATRFSGGVASHQCHGLTLFISSHNIILGPRILCLWYIVKRTAFSFWFAEQRCLRILR